MAHVLGTTRCSPKYYMCVLCTTTVYTLYYYTRIKIITHAQKNIYIHIYPVGTNRPLFRGICKACMWEHLVLDDNDVQTTQQANLKGEDKRIVEKRESDEPRMAAAKGKERWRKNKRGKRSAGGVWVERGKEKEDWRGKRKELRRRRIEDRR